MATDPTPATAPLYQGKPITPGWWWIRFPDRPEPHHWDGSYWTSDSHYATAEDYADYPIIAPCPMPA